MTRARNALSEGRVVTFFYGSYINLDVLKEVDLVPGRVEVARLPGCDIVIAPLANLVPSDQHWVYGILAKTPHRGVLLALLFARLNRDGQVRQRADHQADRRGPG